jgi:uridine phosphorylase
MSSKPGIPVDSDSRARLWPILDYSLTSPTVFSPGELITVVRDQRGLVNSVLPDVCVLDFDGDLTDELVRSGEVSPCHDWPCFHTAMFTIANGVSRYGLIARTIGGPYAVLVAEQLVACGVKAIVGLASAGRVSPELPLPALVIASGAVRDEGTSYHYLPPSNLVDAPSGVAAILTEELVPIGLATEVGLVWTTDAPYRETAEQWNRHQQAGVLAVEMQAASLFAFSACSGIPVGLVAYLTNAPDHRDRSFDKGTLSEQRQILHGIARASRRMASSVSLPKRN